MRRIGIGLLACFALLNGCEKREAFHLKADVLEIELNENLPEDEIKSMIECGKYCEQLQIDTSLVVNSKVGEYPIRITLGNYSDEITIKVKDNLPPKISVEEFTLLVDQNVIWNRELFEELNVKVSDNITSLNELYKNISVSGIDTSELGWQEATFEVSDEDGNTARCEVWVEVVKEKKETIDEESEVEEEEKADPSEELIELPTLQYDKEGNAEIFYDTTASQFTEFLKHEDESFILLISQNRSNPCEAMEEKLKVYFNEHTPLLIYRINISKEPFQMVVENEIRRYEPTALNHLLEDLELPFLGTPAMYLLKDNQSRETLVGNEDEKNIDIFMQKAYELAGIEDEYEKESQ